MIQLSNVSKTYLQKEVLSSVSLSLAFGKTHVLWGSSGSGKTTILRLLSGLTRPTSGKIFLDGTDLVGLTQFQLAQKIGYVIQEGGLFPHLTARENLGLATMSRAWSKSDTLNRIAELAELVQIDQDVLNRYPKKLSGGERQRVALMRALMLDPKIILLDEPLGALDPLVRAELQKELKRIFNALQKTVVLVTHDIGEGAFFGHTISLFHQAKLIQHGEFKDFVEKPNSEFVSRFLLAQAPPLELVEAFR